MKTSRQPAPTPGMVCGRYTRTNATGGLVPSEAAARMNLELVDLENKSQEDLARFDAIVIGSRAYEIDPALGSARTACEALMERGLLSKETHETVVRLAPPLVIDKADIDWAVDTLRDVLSDMDRVRLAS